MESLESKFDYFRYQECPTLLVNADDETLNLFVGDCFVVKRAVAHAINLIGLDLESGEPTSQAPEPMRFLKWFFQNITSQEILFASFKEIGHVVTAHHFMNLVVAFPELSHALIINLFSSIDNISDGIGDLNIFNYTYAYRWLEYGILRRANILLEGAPTRKFELSQLIPIALSTGGRSMRAVYGVSRSIVGAAFDGGQLSKESIAMLLEVFPRDRYFEVRLQELP